MKKLKTFFDKKWHHMTIQRKMISMFVLVTLLILAVNLFMYSIINDMSKEIQNVYESNVTLNTLSSSIELTQENMKEYLQTRSSDAMEEYYKNKQNYLDALESFNKLNIDDLILINEKNIYELSQTYLSLTEEAITAKRGRNIERYSRFYEQAEQLYKNINTFIYCLNNEQFKVNSETYQNQIRLMYYIIIISVLILITAMLIVINIIIALTRNMTQPFYRLSNAANEIAAGNFDIAEIPIENMDEIGIVTNAFNQMIDNIRIYIDRLRITMEREMQMQTYLKDAQLKYLQAQINPHFLFNTLNAGMQLAMMEGADKTEEFLDNLAAFFRYNVRRNDREATLEEEIQLVDNYVYILNVRFSGEINFTKDIDESLLNLKIPSMILQPLIENAVNYGIRGLDREGLIELSVYRKEDKAYISIWDNGVGMEQSRIEEVLSGEAEKNKSDSNSNGVGIKNVMDRLKLYFRDNAFLSIISEGKDMGTEILITIEINE